MYAYVCLRMPELMCMYYSVIFILRCILEHMQLYVYAFDLSYMEDLVSFSFSWFLLSA